MFLGRVHHIKGNDFLIEAFAQLCTRNSDYILAIVGSDDGHMGECKELVAELGVEDKVIFTGFIGGPEKTRLLLTQISFVKCLGKSRVHGLF